MICSHFFRSAAKLVLVVPSIAARARSLSITMRAAGRAAPALLRRADQHVDAGGRHVDPDRAAGDAVQHEQAADARARRRPLRADSRRASIMPAAVSTCGANTTAGFSARIVATTSSQRCRRVRRLSPGCHWARLQHRGAGRDASHLEDLRPAVAEPAVADHQRLAAGGELARHRLHAEGAAARHEDRRAGVVDLLEHAGDVASSRPGTRCDMWFSARSV